MTRLAMLVAILLAGCSVQVHEESSTSTCFRNGQEVPCGGDGGSASSCSVNGVPCEEWGQPTGPREEIDDHHEGDALYGLDETWTFSVHPNATETLLRVVLSGPNGSGIVHGSYGYEVLSPHGTTRMACDNDSINTQVNSGPHKLYEKDGLAVGDWSFRLCIDPSTIEYDVVVRVLY